MRLLLLAPVLIAMLLPAGCAAPDPAQAAHGPGLDVADVALANGAPQTALRVAREMLAATPDSVPARLRAAAAEQALGQRDQAAADLARVLAVDPDHTQAGLALGRLELAGDAITAAALFRRVAAHAPRDVSALTDLGIALDLQGHHAQAQDAYRSALAIEPSRLATSVNLGLSLALAGDTAQALAILRPLGAAPDASPRVRQDLAAALVMAGDTAGAADVLRDTVPGAQLESTIVGYASLAAPRPPQPVSGSVQ
jgi:Flp pilus assembly protein TadD